MILTGPEIIRQVRLGKITLEPFSLERVNPNSYNYRLGDTIIEIQNTPIDPKKTIRTKTSLIGPRGFVLYPGKIYLAHTHEIIGSNYFVPSLIGRSTIGRLGLWLQVCADLGHVGTRHRWTLELKVVQPLRIYKGMKIGQISFWNISGDTAMKYRGKYHADFIAKPSSLFMEFAP